MKCARSDCTSGQHPVWIPVANFWAKGYKPGDHPPGEIILGLVLCDLCMIKMKHEDVAPDNVWELVSETYKKLGKEEPDRKYAKIIGKHWNQLPETIKESIRKSAK